MKEALRKSTVQKASNELRRLTSITADANSRGLPNGFTAHFLWSRCTRESKQGREWKEDRSVFIQQLNELKCQERQRCELSNRRRYLCTCPGCLHLQRNVKATDFKFNIIDDMVKISSEKVALYQKLLKIHFPSYEPLVRTWLCSFVGYFSPLIR